MCTNTELVESLEDCMDDLVDCFEDFVKKSLMIISVALGTIILMVMYVLKVLADRASAPRTTNEGPAYLRRDLQSEGVSTLPHKEGPAYLRRDLQREGVSTLPHKEGPAYLRRDFQSEGLSTLPHKEGPAYLRRDFQSEGVSTSPHKEEPAYLRRDFQSEGVSTLPYKEEPANLRQYRQSGEGSTPPSKDVNIQESMLSKSSTLGYDHSATTPKRINAETGNLEIDNGTTMSHEKVLGDNRLSSSSKAIDWSKSNAARSVTRFVVPSCMAKHHLSSPRPCKRYIAIRSSCCSMCCVDDDRR